MTMIEPNSSYMALPKKNDEKMLMATKAWDCMVRSWTVSSDISESDCGGKTIYNSYPSGSASFDGSYGTR